MDGYGMMVFSHHFRLKKLFGTWDCPATFGPMFDRQSLWLQAGPHGHPGALRAAREGRNSRCYPIAQNPKR